MGRPRFEPLSTQIVKEGENPPTKKPLRSEGIEPLENLHACFPGLKLQQEFCTQRRWGTRSQGEREHNEYLPAT